MHRTIARFLIALAIAFYFCLSMWAVNQQQAAASTQQNHSNKASSATAEITIRGCVSGGNRFTFMQTNTRAAFDLIGKTDPLVPVQGKLIEITATEFAGGGRPDELPKLQVHNLRVIADKCPIQAQPPSANRTPAPAPQNPPGPAQSPSTRPYADPGTVNQSPPNAPNPNINGDTGAPSPGTGNPPPNPSSNNPPP